MLRAYCIFCVVGDVNHEHREGWQLGVHVGVHVSVHVHTSAAADNVEKMNEEALLIPVEIFPFVLVNLQFLKDRFWWSICVFLFTWGVLMKGEGLQDLTDMVSSAAQRTNRPQEEKYSGTCSDPVCVPSADLKQLTAPLPSLRLSSYTS